jgi:hypothetical protein
LLADLGPEAKEAIPALCQSLKSEDYVVQRTAARTLKNLRPEAKDCLPTVLDGLSSKDHIVFGAFRATLEELDCGPAEVPVLVDGLEKTLHSTEEYHSGAAVIIRKLWRMGPDAKDAIPLLKRVVRENLCELGDSARRALLAIEAEQ